MDVGQNDHSPREGACGACNCKLSLGPSPDLLNLSLRPLSSSARPLMTIGPENDGTLVLADGDDISKIHRRAFHATVGPGIEVQGLPLYRPRSQYYVRRSI